MKTREEMKILIKIIVLMVVFLLTTIIKVNAYSSFNASATGSKTEVKPGEEFTVTLSVSDINMGTNGINTLEGKISYDTNIFETITSSSIENLNNWSTTYNGESTTLNGKFLSVNLSSGITQNTNVFSIKFKVKSTITETKNTSIEISDITSNDGTDLISAGSKTVAITVSPENSSNDSGNNSGNNSENDSGNSDENTIITTGTKTITLNSGTSTGNTTNTSTSTSNSTASAKTSSTSSSSSSDIPYTGKSNTIIIGILFLVVLTIGFKIRIHQLRDVK